MTYTLHLGDCLDVLPTLAAGSVDAVICDPPYGTTACAWDSVIPLAPMWEQLKRVVKPRAAIVLFAAQPFTSALWASNPKWFKYAWVWDKQGTANFALAKYQPLRATEDVLVFGKGATVYNPQMRRGDLRGKGGGGECEINGIRPTYAVNDEYYPTNVIRISNANFADRGLHPTQKPVELMRYLVRTYTNAGDTVLDFTMGSGTTGVACRMEGRNFIGVELDPHYYAIAERRIANAQPPLFVADAPTMPTTEQASLLEVYA